ncbi:MAG TPA: TetR/AcrR family transcriptional regulator [Kofleriaceae bacterium]|nr:TetR/AcrR family transcriptional regulator [Kofleriaceae bacterium]
MARQRLSSGKGTRRTRAPGERSRGRVLERAARLATVEGLEGLTIGRLAEVTGMPKSSVYVLFGSKQDLQLATIEAARASFAHEVVAPAAALPAGRARLLALCEGFLSYVERRVFPGGCFFVSAAAEVGSKSGALHDRVAAIQDEWRDLLKAAARRAHADGDVAPGCDPDQLAFELGALLTGANIVAVLHDDDRAIERARVAVRQRLGA